MYVGYSCNSHLGWLCAMIGVVVSQRDSCWSMACHNGGLGAAGLIDWLDVNIQFGTSEACAVD